MLSGQQIAGSQLPHKTICLTFDDGPGETPGNGRGPKTIKLAEYLYSEGIQATFFMVGRHIAQYPQLPAQVLCLGHTIGNHSYNHPHFTRPETFINGETPISEIVKTQQLISQFYPASNIFFRAPYGSWSEEVARQLNASLPPAIDYIGPIGWDINENDWQFWLNSAAAEDCANAYLQAITETGKGIVVMHDSTSDNDTMRINNLTFEAVQVMVPRLKAEDYQFISLQTALAVQGF